MFIELTKHILLSAAHVYEVSKYFDWWIVTMSTTNCPNI